MGINYENLCYQWMRLFNVKLCSYLMQFHHSLEAVIIIIPYMKIIEFINCYSISEVATVYRLEKGYIFFNFQVL